MSELPKPSPSAAVTVNYAPEFCVASERLPRKTVGCFVVTVFQVADNKGNTIHVKRGRNYYGKMRHIPGRVRVGIRQASKGLLPARLGYPAIYLFVQVILLRLRLRLAEGPGEKTLST